MRLARSRAARRRARHAAAAFRLSSSLRPWSMAEIFVVGTAVALVKVADIARVGLGPAFWAFALMVCVIALKDTLTSDWTLWTEIDPTPPT